MRRIDVIVVNYRTPDLVRDAVGPLTGRADIGVFVVDNSDDIHGEMPGVEIWRPGRNVYFAHGNNHWYDATTAPFVLLLNPDVRVSPDVVVELADALDGDARAWGATPRLIDADGRDNPYYQRLPTARAIVASLDRRLRWVGESALTRMTYADRDPALPGVIEQPAAACLLLRRSLVGATLFDERFRLFFNDTYLAWRLDRSGHCLYLPHLTAEHLRGSSLRRSSPALIRGEYARSAADYATATRMPGRQLLRPLLLGYRGVVRAAARAGRL